MAKRRSINIIVAAKDQSPAAFRGVERRLDMLKSRVFSLKNALVGALGGAAIGRILKDSVVAFGRQEEAVVNLTNSLALLGVQGQQATDDMVMFAKSIQEQTRIGDEAVLELAALGAGLGQLTGEGLKDATTAAIGLSRRLKVDTVSAMRLVSRAAIGDTSTLSRYGIKLDETLSAQERFNTLLVMGADAFSLAQGEIFTSAGRLDQMTNSVGDLQEKIGEALIPTMNRWVESGKSVVEILDELTAEEMQDLIDTAKTAGKILLAVFVAPKIVGGIRLMTGAIIAFNKSMFVFVAQQKIVGATVGANILVINASTAAYVKHRAAQAAVALGAVAVVAAIGYIIFKALELKKVAIESAVEMRTFGRMTQSAARARKELAEARVDRNFDAQAAAAKRLIDIEEQLVEMELKTAEAEAESHIGVAALRRSENAKRRIEDLEKTIVLAERLGRREKAIAAGIQRRQEAREANQAEIDRIQKNALKETQRLEDLKVQFIVDRTQREVAAITLRYDREIELARKAFLETARLEKLKELEIGLIRKRAEDKRQADLATAAKAAATKRRDEEQALAKDAADKRQRALEIVRSIDEENLAEAARLQVELSEKGWEKERKLLELKHAEEFKIQKAAGADLAILRDRQAKELALALREFKDRGAGGGGDATAGGVAAKEARFLRTAGKFLGKPLEDTAKKQLGVQEKQLKITTKALRDHEAGREELRTTIIQLMQLMPRTAEFN